MCNLCSPNTQDAFGVPASQLTCELEIDLPELIRTLGKTPDLLCCAGIMADARTRRINEAFWRRARIGDFQDLLCVALNSKPVASVNRARVKAARDASAPALIGDIVKLALASGVCAIAYENGDACAVNQSFEEALFFKPDHHTNALKLMRVLYDKKLRGVGEEALDFVVSRICVGILLGYSSCDIRAFVRKNYWVLSFDKLYVKATRYLNETLANPQSLEELDARLCADGQKRGRFVRLDAGFTAARAVFDRVAY